MRKLKLFSLALMALFATSAWAANDVYYVMLYKSITEAGVLTSNSSLSNGIVKYTSSTGKYASSTDITVTGMGTDKSSKYSNSNISNFTTVGNWAAGSGTAYAAGGKFTSLTIALGAKHASSIKFIGYRNSNSTGEMTIGGTTKTTAKKPSTYGNDCLLEWTGDFTGDINVSIKEDKEHVGVFVITVPFITYSVTIDPNGGDYASTLEGWTKTDGKYTKSVEKGSFSVPAGLTNGDNDLTGWKDKYGTDISLPLTLNKDTLLIAQWGSHSTHSDATLSALSVAGCTLSPAFAPATTAYTIALPFYASMPVVGDVTATKNDSYAKTPVVSISGNVITVHCVAEDETTEKDYTITVNFAPVPTASTSINIEQNILDNTKKWNVASALTAANIVTDGQNGLDSINESKPYRNYAFWGLKLKKNDADILKVIVPAGKVLNIKIGSIGAAVNVLINGEAYTTIPADKDKINHFFHLDATANPREVIFHTTANETTTLQQVKIGEECDDFTLPALYTVTYNAGAGSCEKASDFVEFADDQITLPEATPATGYGFDGWYNAATEGTKVGDAGDKITLTKDSTLYAHYSIINYTITCSPTENGKVEANKATAHYGDLVTLTVTADPGYKVTSVKYNDVVVEPVESVYSFEMPAAAVTVTAVFSLATGIENQESKIDNRKFIKDGQLFIEKNGHVYNVFGACVK